MFIILLCCFLLFSGVKVTISHKSCQDIQSNST